MTNELTVNQLALALIKSWPVIAFLIIMAFHAGTTFYMVLTHNRKINQLIKQDEEIKKSISKQFYDDQNQPIYMAVGGCMLRQDDCQKAFCRKVEELKMENKTNHDTLFEKADENRDQITQQQLEVSVALTRNTVALEEMLKKLDTFISHAPPEHYHDSSGRVKRTSR